LHRQFRADLRLPDHPGDVAVEDILDGIHCVLDFRQLIPQGDGNERDEFHAQQ
jgi:hypothetical protein